MKRVNPSFANGMCDCRASILALLVLVARTGAQVNQDDRKLADQALSIIYQHCSGCHKADGISPFALVKHEDVDKRAKQIGVVVGTRYMPPWLPEVNHKDARFAGERRLTAQEFEVLCQWAQSGVGLKAQATDRSLNVVDGACDAWPLGEPDLVLTLSKPYVIPARGDDVVRTFVFPVELLEDQFVRAIDFRPGNPRVVHHASFSMDDTGSGRMLDAGDVEPGYASMGDIGFNLSGSWGVWSPARPTKSEIERMILPAHVARPLPNQCDILVEVHFNLTGKPETIQPQVALYFTNEPVRKKPVPLTMGTSHIDIASGEKDYIVRDELILPAEVQLHSLAPRAHFICTKMMVTATFPDGRNLQLLRINDWDFNWAQEYRYESPLCLPEGTRIAMEFVYDNSEDNPRNPSHPPQRVMAGFRPIDEMGLLFLYVVPEGRGEHETLERLERERIVQRMHDAKAKRTGQ